MRPLQFGFMVHLACHKVETEQQDFAGTQELRYAGLLNMGEPAVCQRTLRCFSHRSPRVPPFIEGMGNF